MLFGARATSLSLFRESAHRVYCVDVCCYATYSIKMKKKRILGKIIIDCFILLNMHSFAGFSPFSGHTL